MGTGLIAMEQGPLLLIWSITHKEGDQNGGGGGPPGRIGEQWDTHPAPLNQVSPHHLAFYPYTST